MATIKDVARLAKVSVTTVSHVVNKTRFVSPESTQAVEEAIRRVGYVPSAVARSLQGKSTRTLGMLIPNSSNPYFAEIVHSVEKHCFGAGYNLILCNTNDEANRQSVYLQVLAERRIDGLIVVSTGDDNSLVAQLQGLTIPTVLVDRELTELKCDLVETAHRQGGLMATQHLIALGHRNIACMAGPQGLDVSEQRIAGWRQALQDAGLPQMPIEFLVHGDFTSHGGYLAMQAMLQLPQQPSAIFVCNDLMAIGALRAAHEVHVRVPAELSMVGFDDIELASYTSPSLTTIAQPKQRIGVLAVDMLLERIMGGRTQPRKVLLQPELRVRSSSGPCPK